MRRPLPMCVLAAAMLAVACTPAPAAGQALGGSPAQLPPAPPSASGGTTAGGLAADGAAAAPTGGNRYGTPFRIPAVVRRFSATPRAAYVGGTATRLRFRVDSVNARAVHVVVEVRLRGRLVRRLDLRRQSTGRMHSYAWRRHGLGAGSYSLTLRVLDAGGRPLARSARTTVRLRVRPRPRPAPAPPSRTSGVFPVAGSHSYGDGFGVDRGDHIHQGQDIPADEGTPLVAPRRATVMATGYGSAAGEYVVLYDSAANRSYVYFHLHRGSTAVSEGQSVGAGQRIGRVGSTGDATGPHLHFELWVGRWFDGGHAVDPLPTLRSWDR